MALTTREYFFFQSCHHHHQHIHYHVIELFIAHHAFPSNFLNNCVRLACVR